MLSDEQLIELKRALYADTNGDYLASVTIEHVLPGGQESSIQPFYMSFDAARLCGHGHLDMVKKHLQKVSADFLGVDPKEMAVEIFIARHAIEPAYPPGSKQDPIVIPDSPVPEDRESKKQARKRRNRMWDERF